MHDMRIACQGDRQQKQPSSSIAVTVVIVLNVLDMAWVTCIACHVCTSHWCEAFSAFGQDEQDCSMSAIICVTQISGT